jgi:pimeloyl-ACP methyl ester carboxylesterase
MLRLALMKPRILPAADRLARYVLNRRGFESRWIDTGGARVHVYDAPGSGDLPTTVVLHGMGSAASTFGAVMARLRRDARRVIAPEMPAHGFSGVPRGRLTLELIYGALRAALDRIVDEPFVFVGNSLGGALALSYALERPERLSSLVLVSPAGARMQDHEWRALLAAFRIHSTEDARRFFAKLYHRQPWFVPLIAREFRGMLSRPEWRDLLDALSPDSALTPEQLARLRVPTLLLWGRSERLLPASSLAYFRSHLPGHAVIEEPEGFGHCPHLDDPGRVAERVVLFARSARRPDVL